MKELLKKLHAAKQQIKKTDLKKAGYNEYSSFHYWTPEQIEDLVFEASTKNNLLTHFDLNRNDLGLYGQLDIYDLETGEKISYIMATAMPTITATNATQQLGGCMTYTERYLKMTAFGIHMNALDPDAQKPEKQPTQNSTASKPQQSNQSEPDTWLNLFDKQGNKTDKYSEIEKALADGKSFTLAGIRKKYKVGKEVAGQLESIFKIK
jgi:hypothetical protein